MNTNINSDQIAFEAIQCFISFITELDDALLLQLIEFFLPAFTIFGPEVVCVFVGVSSDEFDNFVLDLRKIFESFSFVRNKIINLGHKRLQSGCMLRKIFFLS